MSTENENKDINATSHKTDVMTSNLAECGNKSKPLLGEVYWTFNIAYFPVQVEVLELDIDNRMARINQGWISFDRLYESEDKCPQR